MIDTIRFEIKDIGVGNPVGYEYINGKKQIKYSNGTNRKVYEFLKSWGSGHVSYDVEKNRHMQRELSVNLDSETYSEKYRIVNRQASSNYKITILASVPNDSLIIEFSVPKYFYGTNVFQFIESPLQQKFQFGENVSMEYHFKKMRDYLKTAITTFNAKEFPGIVINYEHVFMRRIDICYNAVFRTVKEKLDYLNMQKQLQKKYDRGTKNRHYKESIFINTKDYSFKIYDKGEEFRKSDFKKLRPFYEKAEMVGADPKYDTKTDQFKNQKHSAQKRSSRILGRNSEGFHLEEGKEKLLELSSRILRFEMTFRNSYFSYIYNNKIRGMDSEVYKSKKKIFYSKLKSIEQGKGEKGSLIRGNETLLKHISDSIALPVDEGLTVYSYLEEKFRLQHIKTEAKEDLNFWIPYYKKEYKIWTDEINRERNFALKLSAKNRHCNAENLIAEHSQMQNVPLDFGSLMLDEITKIFKANVLQFIPKKYDSYSFMVKKLLDHNDLVEQNRAYLKENKLYFSKLSPNFFKGIFLVLKSTTFKKYKQLIEMPDSTYHRIKAQLLVLGISEDMVVADFDIDIDLSFETYYQEMNTFHHLFYQFIDSTLEL